MDVSPGTISFWSDVGCPWASLAVHRLHETRDRLGLSEQVRIDHRCFPLELVNEQSTPKLVLDSEVAVIGAHEPALDWRPWRRPDWQYAVSTLPALEAVQAAKADDVGGPRASEQLDRALRTALYRDSACITLHTVLLDVAKSCDAVNTDALAAALEAGTARAVVFADAETWQSIGVQGSPHLFLPDGTDSHNPGVRKSWTGDGPSRGLPTIDADDRSVYADLLRRAAA